MSTSADVLNSIAQERSNSAATTVAPTDDLASRIAAVSQPRPQQAQTDDLSARVQQVAGRTSADVLNQVATGSTVDAQETPAQKEIRELNFPATFKAIESPPMEGYPVPGGPILKAAGAAVPVAEKVLQLTESQLGKFVDAYPHLAKLAGHLGLPATAIGAYEVFKKLFGGP